MAMDVISNMAGSLDAELEKARETLRTVDDDIKKVFGKEASELTIFGRNRRLGGGEVPKEDHYPPRGGGGGGGRQDLDHGLGGRVRRRDGEDRDGDEPYEKRRREFSGGGGGPGVGGGGSSRGPGGFFQPARGGGFGGRRDSFEGGGGDEFMQAGRRLASRIVSFGKDKSREEVLAEQREDRSGRERNRRMFGALLGTLQRFKQDETKLKDKEDKRAQIEAKLDEAAKQEREVVKTKKQELLKERKLRMTEIKRIEIKKTRLAELEQWEEKTKYLQNFIRTEAKPHIFYIPKVMNPITDCRLEQSKQYVAEMVSHKRKIVLEDLEDYEQRSKRFWDDRLSGRPTHRKITPMDADIEDELQEIIMKQEQDHVNVNNNTDEVEDITVTVFSSASAVGGNEGSHKGKETNGLPSSIYESQQEEGKENRIQDVNEIIKQEEHGVGVVEGVKVEEEEEEAGDLTITKPVDVEPEDTVVQVQVTNNDPPPPETEQSEEVLNTKVEEVGKEEKEQEQ